MRHAHALCLALAIMLPGCSMFQEAGLPTLIPVALPEIPAHCDTAKKPPPVEPKLKADQDATDIDAVRDREAWKKAYRTERAYRATCAQQLKVLLPPEREASKPMS